MLLRRLAGNLEADRDRPVAHRFDIDDLGDLARDEAREEGTDADVFELDHGGREPVVPGTSTDRAVRA